MDKATTTGPGPGDVLGRYQLLTAVGEGGMGRVWAARSVDSKLARVVAVKTAITPQSQSEDFQRMFLDEARIASMIHHPCVCGVYELGEDQGVLYLVMEWCDGASLREVMDRLPDKRIDPVVCSRIVASVAAGLHAAHELEDGDGAPLQVVHRDVSPQNILISRVGHVKVADFGVVKARGQLHRPTETGEMKGKLAYMAPEQVTAKAVDRRADVFALGCVLYEATTGKRPFQGEGALSVLYQLLEQSVTPPQDIVPGYPAPLADIAMKALSKEPDGRFATAEQLRVALEEWTATISDRTTTERSVARLLQETVGPRLEQKAERIRQAVERLEAGEAPDSQPSTRPFSVRTSASAPPDPSGSTLDQPVAAPILQRRGSRLVPAALAAFVLVAGVGGAAILAERSTFGPKDPPSPATLAPQPQALPAAGPSLARDPGQAIERRSTPRRVALSVRATPPQAQLRIDGGEPHGLPLSIELESSDRERRLVVSAPGHEPEEYVLVLDRDRILTTQLRETPRPQAAPRPKPRRARSKPRSVPGSAASKPAEPRPARSTAVDRRAPSLDAPARRPIDADNPF